MRKIILFVCAIIIVALSAVNLNFTLNDNANFNVKLSLKNIVALAMGEQGDRCAVCDNPLDYCRCEGGTITCSQGSCHGKDCHSNTWNILCPCDKTGRPVDICF
jgi:hypothetical protein